MTDPTTTPMPVSIPVDKVLDGFRAALIQYAGRPAAEALERAIMAEATRDALLEQRAAETKDESA